MAKVVDTRVSGNGPKLPDRTTTLHVEYVDPLSGLTYAGDFTVKHLNIREIGQVGVQRARLNGGMDADSLDPRIDQLHNMLAHLQYAVVKAPEWWKPEEFFTTDVVDEVYKKVLDFEYSFRKPLEERSKAAASGSQGEPAGQSGIAPPMVGEEVPATANV